MCLIRSWLNVLLIILLFLPATPNFLTQTTLKQSEIQLFEPQGSKTSEFGSNYMFPNQSTPDQFITVWETSFINSISSNDRQIKLPLLESGVYDFVVEWGDGIENTITNYNQPETLHTYGISGTYTITITGTIQGWNLNNHNSMNDREKLLDILQWGNLTLGDGFRAFDKAVNMVISASDIPDLTQTTDLSFAFRQTKISETGNLNSWDTSEVTNMKFLFYDASDFNQPIDNWDVSLVSDMSSMFFGTTNFNQPLNSWNVSQVTTMDATFYQASSFNQPLNNWDVSNVEDMSYMFYQAFSFNQPLENWDVSNTNRMGSMFYQATSFNQPLNNWNVSAVGSMNSMFKLARSFNQSLSDWNTSNVFSMRAMFDHAVNFNQQLDSWNVSQVRNMIHMLDGVELSVSNYDNLLIEWSQQRLESGFVFTAGNSKYSEKAVEARQSIIDNYNWNIEDAGLLNDSVVGSIVSDEINTNINQIDDDTAPIEVGWNLSIIFYLTSSLLLTSLFRRNYKNNLKN